MILDSGIARQTNNDKHAQSDLLCIISEESDFFCWCMTRPLLAVRSLEEEPFAAAYLTCNIVRFPGKFAVLWSVQPISGPRNPTGPCYSVLYLLGSLSGGLTSVTSPKLLCRFNCQRNRNFSWKCGRYRPTYPSSS